MSNILRSTLRYSVRQLRINCVKQTHDALISRESFQIRKLSCNSSHLNVRYFSYRRSADEKMDMVCENLQKNGRITLREVQEVLKDVESEECGISMYQWVQLIHWCGNPLSEEPPERRIQMVHDVWNVLQKRRKCSLYIGHYNALLKVYLENEHEFSPTDILAELDKKHIQPSRLTYLRFVTYYCQKNDMEGATRMLQLMRERAFSTDIALFNAFVLGHSRKNDMASAEGILNVMKQDGVAPSGETYTILICGYIDQGNLNKVRSLLEECKTNNISLVYEDYLKIKYHSSQKGLDIDEILSTFGFNDGRHKEAIDFINKLVKIEKLDDALKILKNMVRSTPKEEELIEENEHLKRIVGDQWGGKR